MKCSKCHQEIIEELFESKVLGLTLTKIQDWDKPYNEIVVPEGFRKIKVEELWKLLDSEEADSLLGDYKGKFNFFWCEQTKNDKLNKYARRLYLGGSLNLDSYVVNLDVSYDSGRLVFVKEGIIVN